MFQRVNKDGGAERQRARPPRSSVSCSATILAENRFHRGKLLDISSGGCRAEVPEALDPGTGVRVAIEAFHALGGVVRWCRDGQIGIQFNHPIGDYMLAKWQAHLKGAAERAPPAPKQGGRRDFWGETRTLEASDRALVPKIRDVPKAEAPKGSDLPKGGNGVAPGGSAAKGGERQRIEGCAAERTTSVRLALIHVADEADICVVRNISADGLQARIYRRLRPGEKVQLELKADWRVDATVARAQGYDIEVKFDQAIDLAEALSGPWAAESDKRPRLPRLKVECCARMKQGDKTLSIKVVNISQRGLKLEADGGVALSGAVLLSLPGLPVLSGTIRWVDGNEAGVLLDNHLQFEVLAGWIEDRRRR